MAITRTSQSTIKQRLEKNTSFFAGIPPILGRFESIATVTVGSGGASSMTFSDIPGTYQHLQLRWVARSSRATIATDGIRLRFNGDSTSANYVRYHVLSGDGASAAASSDLSSGDGRVLIGNATAAGASASIFGAGISDIRDYASTSKNKTVLTLHGNERNGAGSVAIFSGLWMQTTAISSIVVSLENANFVEFSTAALYGIRS